MVEFLLPTFKFSQTLILYGIIVASSILLGYSWYVVTLIDRRNPGSKLMQDNSRKLIEIGKTFLRKSFKISIPLSIGVGIIFLFIFSILARKNGYFTSPSTFVISFLLGIVASSLSGYLGAIVSIRCQGRTAGASLRNFAHTLDTALKGGAFPVILSASLCLLLEVIILTAYRQGAIFPLLSFGFSFSLTGLFYQSLLTNMTGKTSVENSSECEINPRLLTHLRNCFARSIGLSGIMSAFLTAGVISSVSALAVPSFTSVYAEKAQDLSVSLIYYPFILATLSLIAAIVGLNIASKPDNEEDTPGTFKKRIYIANAIFFLLGTLVSGILIFSSPDATRLGWRFFLIITSGVVLGGFFCVPHHLQLPGEKSDAGKNNSEQQDDITFQVEMFMSRFERFLRLILLLTIGVLIVYYVFLGSSEMQIYSTCLLAAGIFSFSILHVIFQSVSSISQNALALYRDSRKADSPEAKQVETFINRVFWVGKEGTRKTANTFVFIASVSGAALLFAYVLWAGLLPLSTQSLEILTGNIKANPNILLEKISTLGIQVNVPGIFGGLLFGAAATALLIIASGRKKLVVGQTDNDQKRPGNYTLSPLQTSAPTLLGVLFPMLVGFGIGTGAVGAYLAGAILTAVIIPFFISTKPPRDATDVEEKKPDPDQDFSLPGTIVIFTGFLSLFTCFIWQLNEDKWVIRIALSAICLVLIWALANYRVETNVFDKKSPPG